MEYKLAIMAYKSRRTSVPSIISQPSD